MASNIIEFEAKLGAYIETLVPSQAVAFHKKIALEALTRVVLKTPLLSGRARGNWQVTIGAPASGTTAPDAAGNSTINAGLFQLTNLQPFTVVFLTNNVEHIEILENGGFLPKNPGPSSDPRPGRFGRVLVKDGYSIQAPKGMVLETISELLTIFE